LNYFWKVIYPTLITSDASMAAKNYITRITDWCILGIQGIVEQSM